MKLLRYFLLSCLAVLLFLILGPLNNVTETQSQAVEWSYEGNTGPDEWGELKPEFQTCAIGSKQSPVDIDQTSQAQLSNIVFDYSNTPLKIINNGHTIELEYEPGSSIQFDGKQYELLQFHFHAPSEHTVNGKAYPLEAHLVHRSEDGELAVIGVFVEEGKSNAFLQTLWANIPEEKGEKKVNGVIINASALPPADKSRYQYIGSLTTPPCTEGVKWIVLQTPIELSAEQIEQFTSFYSKNARTVQPLNERVIQAAG